MPFQDYKNAIFNRRMLTCIFTGFASGLPLYILIQLVPYWLRKEGVGLAEIGFFTLIGLPYTWKFIWAPFLDRFELTRLGRRRGWMLLSQLALFVSIAFLGFLSPSNNLWTIASLCTAIAFFSATQDVVLDAYRREILPEKELGIGNSIHVNAYRIAGLVPGGLSLALADYLAWQPVFLITAAFMLIAVAMTLVVNEPHHRSPPPSTLKSAVVEPFRDFFQQRGVNNALLILAFMLLYKLGDSMATALQTPFFQDLGFSGTEIGVIAKNISLWAVTIGGIFGGVWMIRLGINRSLWIFGGVQIISILGFALLAHVGADRLVLAVVMFFEYLGVGLGTAAFIAFIYRSTSVQHAATQIALLTALTALPRTLANASTGLIVESVGWELFFYICTLLAVPGMLLLFKVAPWNGDEKAEP